MRRPNEAVKPLRKGVAADSPLFILLMAAILSMAAMTIDINLPAIPITAAEFGAEEALAQLSVAVFFIGFAFGQMAYGSIADRFGRRPVMLAGIAAFVLISLVCAMSPSIELLILLRLLQGLAAACGPILGRAIIRDRFEGEAMARVMSYAMAAFITAPIIAPSIGALILELGSWRLIFVFLALYGGVLWLLTFLYIEESLEQKDPQATDPGRILAAYPAFFRVPVSRVYGGIVILSFSMLVLYLVSAAPIFISHLGLTPRGFGIVFAIIAGCSALGSLLNARLVRHVRLETVILAALAGAVLGLGTGVALALLGRVGLASLLPVFGVFFFAFSLTVSNGTAIAMQPHQRMIGAATSVLGVAQSLVPAAIAGLVATLFEGSPLATLAVMLAMASSALALAAYGHLRLR